MISDEILSAWMGSPRGYGREISSVAKAGYIAWSLKTELSCGVAVPFEDGEPVHEEFARVLLESTEIYLGSGERVRVLALTSSSEFENSPFAAVCSEFISPGPDGALREELTKNPVGWWQEWKTLLGNRNSNDCIYDVVGELLSFKYLIENGYKPIWNGPDKSTYDIDCSKHYVEVKSSVVRSRRSVTLSNKFQLDPPPGSTLSLFFCQFEPAQEGLCINDLIDAISKYGYSRDTLEEKLRKLGYPKGKSARSRKYLLHSMTEYDVDDSFPAIRPSSFAEGKWPDEIEAITYTISLDSGSLNGRNLLSSWSPFGPDCEKC
ncbi:MAG: PD-(D/E)XK motif protein [Eggerthellaceae bacterium]|jgi:hypothetical protein|nr:PD-(D/E)XK motif protein [Eggerthellaceae bacterium]